MSESRSPPGTHGGSERYGGRVNVDPRLSKEMYKPIVFGNHQMQFKIFTAVVTAGK